MLRELCSLWMAAALLLSCAACAESGAAHMDFMQVAIEETRDGITHRHGGPFGTIILRLNARRAFSRSVTTTL